MNNNYFDKLNMLIIAAFLLFLMFANINNLFAQYTQPCVLVNYVTQEGRIREINGRCFGSFGETGNIEIKIIKKDIEIVGGWFDFNDDKVYSHYRFYNRVEGAEYDIFTGIIFNEHNMDENRYYCKLIINRLTAYDYLRRFEIFDRQNDTMITQIVIIQQLIGSHLEFSIDWN